MDYEKRKAAWTKYNRSQKKKEARRRYYLANKEKIAEANKKWREENKEKHLEIRRKWRQKKGREYLKSLEDKRPIIKKRAKDAVNNALKSGKLIKKPCKICGDKNSEGHHEDYNNPLEVIWLCRKHHSALHNKKICLLSQ